jgi:small subunit ribosomal protein S9
MAKAKQIESMGISKLMPKVESRIYATGRRKSASARVWIAKGSGMIFVNGREIQDYFRSPILRMDINRPFAVTNSVDMFDVWCTVKGGGPTGQAGAVRLGISRALDKDATENHNPLHKSKLLKRDPRKVERKKYGLRKARRRPQFSKR